MKVRSTQLEEREQHGNEADVVYEGVILNNISGNRPSKYGMNIARKIFTNEELMLGMLSPQKSSSRPSMPRKKADLIKGTQMYFYSCVIAK